MNPVKDSTILIVDDEKLNLVALNKILSPEYTILIAKNGVDAIKKAETEKPSLILLDILMPGMSGFEVLEILKATDSTREIPVIIVSGLNGDEDEVQGFFSGAVDYIRKPFKKEIVRMRVRNQIRLVKQMKIIEDLGLIDPLTGIANRRCFDERMSTEWKRAAREQHPISILMMDLDNFKNYNDTYGHSQGDTLLKRAAQIFKTNAKRGGDIAARLGGEEFIVILPATDRAGAHALAESIRFDMERLTLVLDDGTITTATVSIGTASTIPDEDASETAMQKFIDLADAMCYKAKGLGRNRVCSAEFSCNTPET
ncbi:MAG: diguanylate cyclase [Clostridiales bacterium]|jgi:diguanylate cyclase (GGDEF)-like protein|nr:diguanylate cyclase [Clostridiales bacterium]